MICVLEVIYASKYHLLASKVTYKNDVSRHTTIHTHILQNNLKTA